MQLKFFIPVIWILSSLFVQMAHAENFVIGNFKISSIVNSVYKVSVTLTDPTANRVVIIDCLEGRKPTSTIITIVPGIRVANGPAHQIFTGISDFYCSGLVEITRGLEAPSMAALSLDIQFHNQIVRNETYQVLTADNLILNVKGDVRSLKASPGTEIALISKEPVYRGK